MAGFTHFRANPTEKPFLTLWFLVAGRRYKRAAPYDKASKIAHYAMDNDLTLKDAALKLGLVNEEEFDRVVDPAKMVQPYVATAE
ncbi:MAG: hypothetical protein P8Y27_20965 [Chromatiaceae bacterium]